MAGEDVETHRGEVARRIERERERERESVCWRVLYDRF